MIVVVMGVCACGKTTIGQALSQKLGWRFYDGDDFHSDSNRAKMSSAIPLTDEDRKPWLMTLAQLARKETDNGRSSVIACSALKIYYRNILRGQIDTDGLNTTNLAIRFVYLKVDEKTVECRLSRRSGHFFKNNSQLIRDQFNALEEPSVQVEKDTLTIDGTMDYADIVEIVKKWLVDQ